MSQMTPLHSLSSAKICSMECWCYIFSMFKRFIIYLSILLSNIKFCHHCKKIRQPFIINLIKLILINRLKFNLHLTYYLCYQTTHCVTVLLRKIYIITATLEDKLDLNGKWSENCPGFLSLLFPVRKYRLNWNVSNKLQT